MLINFGYSVIRSNFLKAFGILQHHDPVQWTFHLADLFTSQLGTSNYLMEHARVANIANETIDALNKQALFTTGSMTEQRPRSVLELFCYI